MEIEKGGLGNGEYYIAFDTNNGNDRLAIAEYKSQLRFAIRTENDSRVVTYLSRETVQTLLPYLQAYAETGQLELQETKIANYVKYIKALVQSSNDACENIDLLEQLVREWRDFVVGVAPNFTLEQLQEQTSHLLEEEN